MHACVCEYKSVLLYRLQKNEGLDIVTSTFTENFSVNKTTPRRGKRYFADISRAFSLLEVPTSILYKLSQDED